jgi:hypothetical protein
MSYRFAADALLVLHLAFILFVLFGGLLALRWRWVPWLHLPAAAWGAAVELLHLYCPLTPWEKALRMAAGEAGYPGDFIEHYLLRLIYPDGLTAQVQLYLGGVVLLLNLLVYGLLLRRGWRRRG